LWWMVTILRADRPPLMLRAASRRAACGPLRSIVFALGRGRVCPQGTRRKVPAGAVITQPQATKSTAIPINTQSVVSISKDIFFSP
jgi:hypothetical protein